MTKYLASWIINPCDDNVDVQSCPLHRLCLLFSHRNSLFRFNGAPWFLFNHLVVSIIRFSCKLFYKLLYTESIERKPLPTLTKFLHGLHGLPFEKMTAVIWRSKKGKKVEEWTGSKFITVLKFCSSCYLCMLAALDKTFEHLCKSCDNHKP